MIKPIIDSSVKPLIKPVVMRKGEGIGFVPSDVPQAEADALINFYYAIDGPNWTDNTGWLTDSTEGR